MLTPAKNLCYGTVASKGAWRRSSVCGRLWWRCPRSQSLKCDALRPSGEPPLTAVPAAAGVPSPRVMPQGDNAADHGQSSTSHGTRHEHWQDAYAALRKMAAFRLASIPRGPTFQPTDVLHEAFVRILESESRAKCQIEPKGSVGELGERTDEARAVATLAAAIRSVLVDRVRRRDVRRRHHVGVAQLERNRSGSRQPGWELLELDEALHQLAAIDPRAARVVELRYFAGLSVQHTATLIGQALSTTERDWRFAKAWLAARLGQRGVCSTSEPSEDFVQNHEGAGSSGA